MSVNGTIVNYLEDDGLDGTKFPPDIGRGKYCVAIVCGSTTPWSTDSPIIGGDSVSLMVIKPGSISFLDNVPYGHTIGSWKRIGDIAPAYQETV